jgi:hypothetical protein
MSILTLGKIASTMQDMNERLSIKSAFAVVLCLSLAVILLDKSLYAETISASIWDMPFGKPASIWRALSSDYEIASVDSGQTSVNTEIHWFQQHQDYITELTHNAQPYIYYVYQQLRKRHMPAELALLPMVESSYVPFQSSHVGATGLWQMMPDTASGLGLKAWGADGRRNVIASTNAALVYLAYLHRLFGSWPLALAAYNAGEGTVQHAIEQNIKHHLPTNFWSLHLPKETEEYVPKLLALAAIVEDPQRYNVHLEPVANKAFFGAVKVDKKINLDDVAKMSGTDTNTIHKLNPGIKSTEAPISTKKSEYLLVPIDKVPVLQANLNNSKVVAATVASTKTAPKAAPAVIHKAVVSHHNTTHASAKKAAHVSAVHKQSDKNTHHSTAAHKVAAHKTATHKAAAHKKSAANVHQSTAHKKSAEKAQHSSPHQTAAHHSTHHAKSKSHKKHTHTKN